MVAVPEVAWLWLPAALANVVLLTSFTADERKCLSDKIKAIGGILYESSVRLLYLEVKYVKTSTNNV